MTFVKILAPLTGGARDNAVLASAFAAAKPFNAHVAALFVRPDATEAVPFYGESVSANVMQEIADASKKAADEAIKVAKASLQAAAKEAGASVQDAPQRDPRQTEGRQGQGVRLQTPGRAELPGVVADPFLRVQPGADGEQHRHGQGRLERLEQRGGAPGPRRRVSATRPPRDVSIDIRRVGGDRCQRSSDVFLRRPPAVCSIVTGRPSPAMAATTELWRQTCPRTRAMV